MTKVTTINYTLFLFNALCTVFELKLTIIPTEVQ